MRNSFTLTTKEQHVPSYNVGGFYWSNISACGRVPRQKQIKIFAFVERFPCLRSFGSLHIKGTPKIYEYHIYRIPKCKHRFLTFDLYWFPPTISQCCHSAQRNFSDLFYVICEMQFKLISFKFQRFALERPVLSCWCL